MQLHLYYPFESVVTVKKPAVDQQALAGGCACFSLRRAARMMAQVYDQHLRPVGIKNTQFSLLAALAQEGPVSVNELARIMAMDRTTLTRNLRVLEERGLVRIVPGRDARTKAVSLSRAGRGLLKHATPHWNEAQERVLQRFGDTRWQAFRSDLGEMEALASSLR